MSVKYLVSIWNYKLILIPFCNFSIIPTNQTKWIITLQERKIWWHDPEYEWYYKVVYHGFEQLIALGVLPLIWLVYYNFSVYDAFKMPQNMEIMASEEILRNSREKRLSKVLISIVIIFIFCQSFRIIWYLYYSINYNNIVNCLKQTPSKSGEPPWSYVLALLYELFLIINSSVNTIVYCTVNTAFRCRLMRYLSAPFRRFQHYITSYSYPQISTV